MSADFLASAYGGILRVLAEIDEAASWTPTGCPGWTVRDLTYHLVEDARRGLVAVHNPVAQASDTDRFRYWAGWGSDATTAADGRRFARVSASLFGRWEALHVLYAETARALLQAAADCDEQVVVGTQGHVIAAADLLSTLAVEATVHHLDLVAHLPLPGPGRDALAGTRSVLDGVAGDPGFPAAYDDEQILRLATGRAVPTPEELLALGDLGHRLPLFC